MTRITVIGAAGRMGRRILALAKEAKDFQIAAAVEHPKNLREPDAELAALLSGAPLIEELPDEPGVVVDFSLPGSTIKHLNTAVMRGAPYVCGTTGFTGEQILKLSDAARTIPFLHAENMSVGINLLRRLVRQVAKELGEEYEVEIVETHHRSKRDAPSGTALALAKEIASATGRSNEDYVFGRVGEVGARPRRQIGIHAVRMGAEVGMHEIHFASTGEVITLSHRAYSRDTFALGALRAAKWIEGKPPGRYTMNDVLSITDL